MKKNQTALFFSAASLLLLLVAFACTKDSGTNSSALTKENLAGTYVLTAATVSFPPLPPQSILDSIPPCQRDDQYKLNVDLTLNYIDAGTKCTPAGDHNSTWSISGTTLMIDTVSATVQSFNGHVLVVSVPIDFLGVSTTTTETLTKQ